jgi:uncharacterized lipoprotein YbaY
MTRSRVLAVFAAVGAAALVARAEGPAKAPRLWDPATMATVSGTVESVERIAMGDWACVRLRLRTGDGVLSVRVAPEWFLTQRRIAFAAGERLEVKGSRIRFAGEPALTAGEIVRGAERIVLRAADGKAAW